MKKTCKRIVIAAIALVLLFSVMSPAASAASYSAPTGVIRAGLAYSGGAVTSAGLRNMSGGGFRLGYYNDSRTFVEIANINASNISVIIDKNMYYSSSSGYVQGSDGSVQVGCYHVTIDKAYTTYSAASAAAAEFSWAGSFVKYADGYYWVCVGNYTTFSAAESATSWLGISGSWWITSGTSYTLSVVSTGTNTVLFEYDIGSSTKLAVVPSSSDALIRFKNYTYMGGMQFQRIGGGNITVVNFVGIEDYVKGVLPYEMGDYFPLEALKAQAVAARSFVFAYMGKHAGHGFDVCSTDDCQVYRGTSGATYKTNQAVDQTAGKVLMYNGKLCECVYSSSNGGASESCVNVWYSDLKYCLGKVDEYEASVISKISNYYWSYTYTAAELTEKMQTMGYNNGNIVNFYISKFTDTGNVYSITLVDENGKSWTFSKNNARTKLGFNSLRYNITVTVDGTVYVNDGQSTANTSNSYAVGTGRAPGRLGTSSGNLHAITGSGNTEIVGGNKTYNPNTIYTISGTGHGHNVGMSQWGAYAMANNYGKNYVDILTYYYTGVEVVTASVPDVDYDGIGSTSGGSTDSGSGTDAGTGSGSGSGSTGTGSGTSSGGTGRQPGRLNGR